MIPVQNENNDKAEPEDDIAPARVGVLVTVFDHGGSTWTGPVIKGLGAAFLVFSICTVGLSIWFLARRKSTNVKNVQDRIYAWMHKFNLTVKRDPVDGFHFNYIVTTNGKRQIAIGRSAKEWPDYLIFAARISPDKDDLAIIESLTERQRSHIAALMKLELARARMAYSDFSLNGFPIVLRIPITAELNESKFIDAVWKMEAMVNALYMNAQLVIIESDEALALVKQKKPEILE
jgi:hypothetical protein